MRYRLFFSIACGIGAYLFCSAQQATTPVLTLDKCLSIALSESPTVKIADMEVTRTDYSRKETLGQLLPSISFGASYNRTLAKQVMYMNMDGFKGMGGQPGQGDDSDEVQSRAGSSGGDNGIKVGLDNSYNAGFNASMPIIAPQLWQSMKLTDSQILRSVEQDRY